MSYIIQRSWCDIILNVHASAEVISGNTKDRFYEELEHAFHQFPKYHTKIVFGDFSAKVGKEDVFTPIGNESLHEISSDSGVRVIKFATSET
jgi:hypothetical protein